MHSALNSGRQRTGPEKENLAPTDRREVEKETDYGMAYYLAKTNFAACALAREAAFLCTTPDFTALSIAEVYSDAAAFVAAASPALAAVSSFLCRVLIRVFTPWLRAWRR